ncbi:transposase [Rhodovulum sulfidophilum]|nr:transposase [Rhodovulum sulfidophilum]
MAVQIPYRRSGTPLNLLIDSTGVKFRGDGEWPVHKHGPLRRRQWRKVHIAADTGAGEVRGVEFTSSRQRDSPLLRELLMQIPDGEEIATVAADGACDTWRCHAAIIERGADAVIRGCPICLRGGSSDHRPPLRQMVMQGSWLCRGVDICLEHNHLLVPLWQATTPIERENTGARLSEIWPDLRNGRLDQEPIPPTSYDHWLDTRLSRLTDPSWLASLSSLPSPSAVCSGRSFGVFRTCPRMIAKPRQPAFILPLAARRR